MSTCARDEDDAVSVTDPSNTSPVLPRLSFVVLLEYDMAQMFLHLGKAPAHPLLKSKGTYKPPAATVKPPEGSI